MDKFRAHVAASSAAATGGRVLPRLDRSHRIITAATPPPAAQHTDAGYTAEQAKNQLRAAEQQLESTKRELAAARQMTPAGQGPSREVVAKIKLLEQSVKSAQQVVNAKRAQVQGTGR